MSDADMMGLIIKLEAQTRQLQRDFARANAIQAKAAQQMEAKAKQSADKISKTYEGMGSRIGAAFKTIAMPTAAGLAGAGLGVAGTAAAVRNQVRAVAELSNEAKRAGVGLDTFQEWKFVAEQNRIGIDAMTDGLKELHIRAGEFFLDDAGAGAEAFRKLGYSADELKVKLQAPSDLMVEILGRLSKLDQAGRSFLLEEIFGGAGGEQFSALIGQGEAALRATIARAHETGAVLDAELIAKAEELDRKFSALTTTAANFGKRVAVSLASAGVEMLDLRERLGRIFPDEAQGRAVLGNELFDALDNNRNALTAQASDVEGLARAHQRLASDARAAAHEIGVAAQELPTTGFEDQRAALEQNVAEMRRLAEGIDNGTISAAEFGQGMDKAAREAEAMFDAIASDEGIYFANVTAALSGLMDRLAGAISMAASLKGALQQAVSIDPVSKARQAELDRLAAEKASIANEKAQADTNRKFADSEEARNRASGDALRLQRELEAVRKRAAEAGASLTEAQALEAARAALAGDEVRQAAARAGSGAGGGGQRKLDDFAREAEGIRDRTQALEAEAVMLGRVMETQRRQGAAVEFARAKSELLVAAQRSGHALTPELTAGIDRLAQAYVDAGLKAQQAADDLQAVEDRGKRGAEALGDVFTSVLTGAQSAEEAVAGLLLEIAKAQFNKTFAGLFDGGGASGILGGLLGFASGGYTGPGSKYQPAGVVHANEYVFSSEAVNRIGAGNLEAMHRAAKSGALGYASGGVVGGGGIVGKAVSARAMDSERASAPQITISAPVTVNATGGSPEQNHDLARRMAKESEAMMRNVIRDELIRQMRPGGALR